MRTCWPTRNFGLLKRRVWAALPRILFQIVKTSVSRTSAGAIPVLEWTLALYPWKIWAGRLNNDTCSYRWNICAVYRAEFCWHAPRMHIWRRDFYRLETLYPHILTTLEIGIQKLFALICTHPHGSSAYGFVYIGYLNMDSSAAATSFPVFVRKGTLCRYFENTSITCNRYL